MNENLSSGLVRIDAHQHFWRPTRGDYDWMNGASPALAPLRRDYLPDELWPHLEAGNVRHTVLVQAAATEAETLFMLELARGTSWISGVVGWTDLASQQAPAHIERMAGVPKFCGFRPMLQDLPDPSWLLHAPRPAVWDVMCALGLRLDALIKFHQLPMLRCFVEHHDGLQVVVDHAAKPPLRDGWYGLAMEKWRAQMRALAKHPSVVCKFSGLMTEAAEVDVATLESSINTLRPVLDWLLECFGAERLIWGSDWPVLNLAGSYGRWLSVCEALFEGLTTAEQSQIWAENARSFYALHIN